ncbi:DUF6234 family protein [Kitasatospora sp. NPDC054939]
MPLTARVHRPPTRRSHSRLRDVLGCLALLLSEAAALAYLGLMAGMEQWAAQGDPDYSDVATGLGILALVAAGFALAVRRAAPITAVTQVLVTLAVGFLALSTAFPGTPDGTGQHGPAKPAPAATTPRHGEGPCRSGGTDDECRLTGG